MPEGAPRGSIVSVLAAAVPPIANSLCVLLNIDQEKEKNSKSQRLAMFIPASPPSDDIAPHRRFGGLGSRQTSAIG